MSKITSIVAVYNEEKNIRECLESLSFSDEIIVIDSNSDDKTVELARKYGAKPILTDVMYPEIKKNMAIKNAETSWIFILDADERVSPALAAEIKEAVKQQEYDGFWIYRKNYFLGKEIKHCGWNKDRLIRLFKKGTAEYPEKRVHGQIEFNGRAGILKNRILHFTYGSIDEYIEKVQRYSLWNAEDMSGVYVNPMKIIFNPVFRFIKMFFLRLGFLDGFKGFVISVMASYSVFLKYLRSYYRK